MSDLMEDGREALNISTLKAVIGARCHLQHLQSDERRRGQPQPGRSLRFDGEGTRVHTCGVNLLQRPQHGDTTMVVDHAVPHCASREVFSAVLDDEGARVFQGKIIVRPDAQKTDGKMETQALLLSDDAEIDNKPELEIFADDVSCGHGATSGALDEDLLFYLRARGIPEKDAAGASDPGFRRRGDRGDCRMMRLREAATSAAVRWLERASEDDPSSGEERAPTTSKRIREDFPALSMQVYGKPLVYLDNAASAQKPTGGARPHAAGLHGRIRQRASRAALSRQCCDRSL